MKLNVLLVEDYPHPVEKVWRALTDPNALSAWLMANDFEPHVGKRFVLRGREVPPPPGWRGWHECEVLELERPRRTLDGAKRSRAKEPATCAKMVWSWISNEADAPSRVEFRLEEIEGGTRLTLSHTGEIDPVMGSRLREGWPRKLAGLRAHMSAII